MNTRVLQQSDFAETLIGAVVVAVAVAFLAFAYFRTGAGKAREAKKEVTRGVTPADDWE